MVSQRRTTANLSKDRSRNTSQIFHAGVANDAGVKPFWWRRRDRSVYRIQLSSSRLVPLS